MSNGDTGLDWQKWDFTDPYGTTSDQALNTALANIAYQSKSFGRQWGEQDVGIRKAYKREKPRSEERFARRGLVDSGIRQRGVADLFAARETQHQKARQTLDDALYGMTLEQMGAYGTYSGERFQQMLDAATQRALTASQIREVLG